MHCSACHATVASSAPWCPHCGATNPLDAGHLSAPADPLRAALVETLGHQYDILRLLGRGAMGAVYLAREHSLERLVAIKVLPFEKGTSPDARERFRRESKIAARLMHPNILPLYTCGEVGDLAYFIMGYVHGQSLGERLRMEGRIPSETVRRVVAQLADALDYAHRRGVVHRDVKPDNILIDDESGRPLLADFGIAKALSAADKTRVDPLTVTGVAVGTPYYMAPEQGLGGAVDGRSDIYSLGVVAYEMLTGHPPYRGPNAHDVILQHATNQPPSLQLSAPNAPEDLVNAINRCLAKNPDMRWPDGKSLKAAIAPDGLEEDALPHDVGDLIPGFGIWAAAWFVAWGALAVREYAAGRDAVLFAIIALLNPIGFLLNVWSATHSGFRLGLVLRVSCWPPKWWGVWWPRAWRRPGNVWDRLPRPVRLLRLALAAFFIGTPLLTFAAQDAAPQWAVWLGRAKYGIAAATVAVLVYCIWWVRRRGAAWVDLSRLLFGAPVGSSFWGRPDIARLLTPAADAAGRPALPRTTHDYLGAISREAERLVGASRALGNEAVAAARQVMGRIDALDAEIRLLRDAVDPDEVARLERKIAALDVAGPAEAPDRLAMRELLANKLELARRMISRLDDATARRAHLADLLRDLCEQLGDLRRQSPQETDANRVSADRIRSLCRAAEEQAVLAGSRP